MEEILASIRRIISEDGAKEAAPAAEPEPRPASPRRDPPPARLHAPPERIQPPLEDDVLELTDVAEEETRPAVRTPLPEPSIDELLGDGNHTPTDDERLLSDQSARAATNAFARLMEPDESPTLPDHMPIGNGRTVEDLVRELLRPMLRDWLDRNLPSLVQQVVEREVAQIARGQRRR